MTLTEFLLARFDEDAMAAQLLKCQCCLRYAVVCDVDVAHSPLAAMVARVLAEVEAKRRIVASMSGGLAAAEARGGLLDLPWSKRFSRDANQQMGVGLAADHVLRLLALPYADHPDYRQEWKP